MSAKSGDFALDKNAKSWICASALAAVLIAACVLLACRRPLSQEQSLYCSSASKRPVRRGAIPRPAPRPPPPPPPSKAASVFSKAPMLPPPPAPCPSPSAEQMWMAECARQPNCRYEIDPLLGCRNANWVLEHARVALTPYTDGGDPGVFYGTLRVSPASGVRNLTPTSIAGIDAYTQANPRRTARTVFSSTCQRQLRNACVATHAFQSFGERSG